MSGFKNILVVDDELSMRQFLKILLKSSGYNVVTAKNGEKALEELQKNKFSVILMDYNMPEAIDGLNLLNEFRKRTPNTQYYSLSEQQKFKQTRYVENVAYDRLHKVSKHAYTYDKAYKESLDYDLTRFELSLSPKFFHKHNADINEIAKALDRYHVMYFPTVAEKQKKLLNMKVLLISE